MPQLIARPGRNAVRQAKKAKEIRHVKGAIIWHEKQRRAHREKIQDRWEVKDQLRQVERWTREEVTLKRKTALRHAGEDWKLGPLRPNRGVNVANGKYAVVTSNQVTKPPLDAKVLKAVNAKREKEGLAPAYPLIVDDKKYFPIVKGDRVVVTKGKDKGKIGEVSAVLERHHSIIVKGLNKAYMDSDGISSGNMGPRVITEIPLDMEYARLVIPYASTSFAPNGQSLYEDVIVDNIVMERHTTGIDPFTGIDYGNQEIPKEHQYDPETGLPIFHRYIAGTPYRIAWPWETETKAGTAPGPDEKAVQGWLSKTLGTLRHPITTLQSWRNPTREEPAEESAPSTLPIATQVEDIEASERMEQRRATLRSEAPGDKEAYAADTERYMVEGNDSMSYTLVAPPFPPTLAQELRGDIFAYTQAARNDPENPHKPVRARFLSPKAEAAQAFAQKKAEAALRMKTPLQLRWEQEQARKLQAQKEKPAVDTETLLAALGQHMQANGVRKNGKRRAASKVAELD